MTVYLVSGPPCSGKSTHIATNRADGAVVIDLDSLAYTLGHRSTQPTYDDPHPAKAAAQIARQSLIKAALTGRLRADEVWIVDSNRTVPIVAHHPGVVRVDLDPGIDQCIEHARAAGRDESTVDAIKAWYAGDTPSRSW